MVNETLTFQLNHQSHATYQLRGHTSLPRNHTTLRGFLEQFQASYHLPATCSKNLLSLKNSIFFF